MPRTTHKPTDINVVGTDRNGEQYVFLYRDADRTALLRCLGRFANNPQLSFTWYDAALLAKRVREDEATHG